MSAARDTSRAAEERYFELLRQRTPRERAAILAGLNTAVRRLAFASERATHPELPGAGGGSSRGGPALRCERRREVLPRRFHRMTAHDPIAIALRVATAIESVGGAYFVGGSVASSLQGDPRSTNDIDIVVSLAANKVDALATALGPDFEVDQDMLRQALLAGTSANAFFSSGPNQDRFSSGWGGPSSTNRSSHAVARSSWATWERAWS